MTHPQVFDSEERGVVTLMATLVLGALGLTISVSLLLLSLSQSRSSFVLEQSIQARSLANACAEHALNQFRLSQNYSGNETLTLGTGTCTIGPLLGSGSADRTIQATGTVGSVVRKIKVIIARRQPNIELSSWQEVADF